MYLTNLTEELVQRARLVVERGQGEAARRWLAAHDRSKDLPSVPEWLKEILLYVVEHDVASPAVRYFEVPPRGVPLRSVPERHFLVVLDLIERKRKTGRYARGKSVKTIDDASEAFADALKRLADK